MYTKQLFANQQLLFANQTISWFFERIQLAINKTHYTNTNTKNNAKQCIAWLHGVTSY